MKDDRPSFVTLEYFIEGCRLGRYQDHLGVAYYADEFDKTNEQIKPSSVLAGEELLPYPYVRWFDRPIEMYARQAGMGDLFSFEDFESLCASGVITDKDGFGYYSTKERESTIEVSPSKFLKGERDDRFDYVNWYNK